MSVPAAHAQQTSEIMSRFEPIVLTCKPDVVVVYGDVNSTVAAALVSAKLGIKIAHVEAGLRSFDWSMPEEINRVVTDRLADLLLTPSEDGDNNLIREGVPEKRIRRVGNVMIDSLVRLLPSAERIDRNGYPKSYALCTLHRPSNVDDLPTLLRTINALLAVNRELPVVFPVHPRTRKRIVDSGIEIGSIQMTDPLPYIEFLALQTKATVVITDSGGIQEETTFLGIPCLTVRENTERPITVTMGTNIIVGQDPEKLSTEFAQIISGKSKHGPYPRFGTVTLAIESRMLWTNYCHDSSTLLPLLEYRKLTLRHSSPPSGSGKGSNCRWKRIEPQTER